MVMDAVIRNWVKVVVVEEVEPKGFGRVFHRLALFLCVDNGLLVSPWSASLQEDLEILKGLFEWVGLRTNVE